MTTALSVNVNKIAWLRNAREGDRPDLIQCSRKIIQAGAQGITVHPRSDQRHIRPADVYAVNDLVQELNVEYNIEGNPSVGRLSNGYPGFLELVEDTCPTQCTLVPDNAKQLTSDHGWDLQDKVNFECVRTCIRRIHQIGARVSLFLDPEPQMVERASDCGADRIELFTGPWCDLAAQSGLTSDFTQQSLARYVATASRARELGLEVNAGHDLDLENVGHFCSQIPVAEVSIGHALVSDALEFGLERTVRLYLSAIQGSSNTRTP